MRIGIDVGGTNTDAALVDGDRVVATVKTPTTPEVSEGIARALRGIVADAGGALARVDAVMIGTTHFTNAVVQRRDLAKTAAIRRCPSCGPRFAIIPTSSASWSAAAPVAGSSTERSSA